VDFSSVRSLIVPGGNIKNIDKKEIFETIVKLNDKKVLIAGICAGVDILDKAGILKNIPSTHSVDADCVSNGNIVTARANAYVDFAIEVGKALELFEDDADLKETIEFWKHHKRVQ
jgi:putative intracellular protease/amidase